LFVFDPRRNLLHKLHLVAAQVEIESKIEAKSKAVDHIFVLSD
jgi:hypothetical protein